MLNKYKRNHRRKVTSGTSEQVVTRCNEFSTRLKDEPINCKLHTRVGSMAEGTVAVEPGPDDVTVLVIKARGLHLFGLVRKEHRHTFTPGDLEKCGTHTAFLRRSIKAIVKGDEKARDDMLERSLSLIHKREAVDITFENKAERDELGDWINAKWSVAKLQKSFRRDARTTLALQGKRHTLNEEGIYEILDAVKAEEGAELVLPKLESDKLEKLQDDLLNGIHVTYHDTAFQGINVRSRPCRLRHDYLSKEGSIILEPSFTDGGPTLVRTLSDLIQVGGGPSASGLTALLLRVTSEHKEARACAVSLVFKDVSMDMTCANEEDATEIVLFFSAAKGFTRAAPPLPPDSPLPLRSLLPSGPGPRTKSDPIPPAMGGLLPKEDHAKAMEALFRSETDDTIDRVLSRHHVEQAAASDLSRSNHRSPPPPKAVSGCEPPKATGAGAGVDEDQVSALRKDWSCRFKQGLPGDGDKDALKKQLSAFSGFGAIPQSPVDSSVGFGSTERDSTGGHHLPSVRETPGMQRQISAESEASAASSFHQGIDYAPTSRTDDRGREVVIKKLTVFHSSHVPVSTVSGVVANPHSSSSGGGYTASPIPKYPMFHSAAAAPSARRADANVSPRRRSTAADRPNGSQHHSNPSRMYPNPKSRDRESVPVPPLIKSPDEVTRTPTPAAPGQTDSGISRHRGAAAVVNTTKRLSERRTSNTPADHLHHFQTSPHDVMMHVYSGEPGGEGGSDLDPGSMSERRRGFAVRRRTMGDSPAKVAGNGATVHIAGRDELDSSSGRSKPKRLNLKEAIPDDRGWRKKNAYTRDRQQEDAGHDIRHGQGGRVRESERGDSLREEEHRHRHRRPGHHPHADFSHREHSRETTSSLAGHAADHGRVGQSSSIAPRSSAVRTHKPKIAIATNTAAPFTSSAAFAMSRAEAEAVSLEKTSLSPISKSGNGRLQGSHAQSHFAPPVDGRAGGGDGDRSSRRPVLRSMSPVDRRREGHVGIVGRYKRDSREARTNSDGGSGGGNRAAAEEALPRPARSKTLGTSNAENGGGGSQDVDRSVSSSSKRRTSAAAFGNLFGSRTSSSAPKNALNSPRGGPEISTGNGQHRSPTPSRLRRVSNGVHGLFNSSHGRSNHGGGGGSAGNGRGVDDFTSVSNSRARSPIRRVFQTSR